MGGDPGKSIITLCTHMNTQNRTNVLDSLMLRYSCKCKLGVTIKIISFVLLTLMNMWGLHGPRKTLKAAQIQSPPKERIHLRQSQVLKDQGEYRKRRPNQIPILHRFYITSVIFSRSVWTPHIQKRKFFSIFVRALKTL